MAEDSTVDAQSKIAIFLNSYKFKVEPDAVLPCEPRPFESPPAAAENPTPPPGPATVPEEFAPPEDFPREVFATVALAASAVLNKSVANKAALNKNKNKSKNKICAEPDRVLARRFAENRAFCFSLGKA